MSRGSVGVALGAAGATAYLRPDIVIDWARNAAVSGSNLGNTASNSREVDQLTKLVEQLANEVRGSRTVTVVHADTGSGRSTLLPVALAVVAASGALYLVALRGWRLRDLAWVTQRAFRQGMTGVSAGLDALNARLIDVKTRLAARIAEVAHKQDEAATAAAAMRAHLVEVGTDVEAVRSQVGQIHASVLDLDSVLADVSANQRHALHGIYVLCKAVGELAAGSQIEAKGELLEFTHSPIWQRVRPQQQGLGTILSQPEPEAWGRHQQQQQPPQPQRYLFGGDTPATPVPAPMGGAGGGGNFGYHKAVPGGAVPGAASAQNAGQGLGYGYQLQLQSTANRNQQYHAAAPLPAASPGSNQSPGGRFASNW